MAVTHLVVGLGNPGEQYSKTRHNAGFWFVETLAARQGCALRLDRAHGCLSGRAGVILYCLPQQFMNRSGQPVASLANYYRLSPEQVIVAHDDLDLAPGQIRVKQGGGHGGHNGLRDIDKHLSSREYLRLRLGIGHPGDKHQVSNYVLNRPSLDDETRILTVIDHAIDALPELLAGKLEVAQRRLHTLKP